MLTHTVVIDNFVVTLNDSSGRSTCRLNSLSLLNTNRLSPPLRQRLTAPEKRRGAVAVEKNEEHSMNELTRGHRLLVEMPHGTR